VREKAPRERLRKLIGTVELAATLSEIPNLKKLKASGHYYRIRVREYRVGITIEGDLVTFVRCLYRKEIYRYFP